MADRITLSGIAVDCIVGVYERERNQEQRIYVDVTFETDAARVAVSDSLEDAVDYHAMSQAVRDTLIEGRFHMIESAAEAIAARCLEEFSVASVDVRVHKPGAIDFVGDVIVEIHRTSSVPAASARGAGVGS